MRSNPFKPIYEICNSSDPVEKLSNLPPFPRYLDIELTNVCNFHCLMCPVGTGSMRRHRGMMHENLFRKIIDEIAVYTTPLRFIRWGEPTLHPEFKNFLRYAKSKNISCHLNTNGSRLDETMIRDFISLPLDSIKFSFQGIDRESYAEMRNTDFFDTLVDKIKLLHMMRAESPFPYIHVATTTTYETEGQIQDFIHMIQKHADLVTVGRTQLDKFDISSVKLNHKDRERLIYLKTQETLHKERFRICPEVFDKLSINWDGTVSACCLDYNNEMVVGNLSNNTLKEIWHSSRMGNYRKLLAQRRYEAIELCSHCYDNMGLQTQK